MTMTMSQPRLLLADDHTLMLEGLRRLLEPEFNVIGTCADGRALLQAAEQLQPDVILLDISMPLLNGLDAAAQLRKILPTARLIFVTMHADPEFVRDALRVGAFGYVIKRCAALELVQAVREVLQGRVYVTPSVQQSVADFFRDPGSKPQQPTGAAGLTLRQREVLQLVAEGHPDKEIASLLHVSEKTVEFHKASIRRQLSLRSTAEMTRYALKHGLTHD
jgi:DNA-binding NarL/FixJ family response regulator